MLISDFKLWGWDKKTRTMLRFIKAGDLFCSKLDEQRYCFGSGMTTRIQTTKLRGSRLLNSTSGK